MKKKLIKTFAVAITLSLFFVTNIIASDIDRLEQRMRESMLEDANASAAGEYLTSLNPNGSWDDVDYASIARANWPPVTHLDRVQTMTEAYSLPDNPYFQDQLIFDKIIQGLEYWYQVAPECDNWWWNVIGKQMRLGVIGVLLKNDLPDDIKNKIIKDLFGRYPNGMKNSVGANRYWYADIAVWGALVSGDEKPIMVARDYYTAELDINNKTDNVTEAGGIKPDYCWWQHGSMLLIGSYGFSAVASVGKQARLFKDLKYSFDQKHLDMLANYINYGILWFVRRKSFDISVKDRVHTRPNAVALNQSEIESLKDLAFTDSKNAAVYNNFLDHIAGENDSSVIGNRHFWYGDFMSHRRMGYMVGLKMQSDRLRGPGSANGENLKCEFMNYGNCFIYKDGDEYTNIFPVWDYAYIPGTTSRYVANPGTGSGKGKTAFVGGTSDGNFGVAVEDLNFKEVSGKQAWFFFDDAFVALGAGITSASNDEINTTLNQCHMDGDTYVEYGKGNGDKVMAGIHSLENPAWVYHDGIGYLFPEGGHVGLKIEERTGDWSDIGASTGTEIHDVFTLYLNHAAKPNNATYQYTVMPDATREEVQAFVASNELEVVENTATLQAVYHNGLKIGGVVFHQPGTLTIRPGFELTVNEPCALLVNESNPEDVKITASNPKNTKLLLKVATRIEGIEEETIFLLPEGGEAGSSLSASIGY